MSRLVDADALKETIEFHPTSVSVCMTFAEAMGQTEFKNRCLDDIDNAPTIDAIPVDWLHKKREQMIDAAQNTPEQAIAYVLWMWKKEQEAR